MADPCAAHRYIEDEATARLLSARAAEFRARRMIQAALLVASLGLGSLTAAVLLVLGRCG